jgi:histone deacetylase complex regulatory component SIN3
VKRNLDVSQLPSYGTSYRILPPSYKRVLADSGEYLDVAGILNDTYVSVPCQPIEQAAPSKSKSSGRSRLEENLMVCEDERYEVLLSVKCSMSVSFCVFFAIFLSVLPSV